MAKRGPSESLDRGRIFVAGLVSPKCEETFGRALHGVISAPKSSLSLKIGNNVEHVMERLLSRGKLEAKLPLEVRSYVERLDLSVEAQFLVVCAYCCWSGEGSDARDSDAAVPLLFCAMGSSTKCLEATQSLIECTLGTVSKIPREWIDAALYSPKRSLVGQLLHGEERRVIDVVLVHDKNETIDGLDLVLMDGRKKIGFMLLEFTAGKGLIMRGMKVNDSFKRRGLSYLFLSVWVLLSQKLGDYRLETKPIDKPLIAMVLQKFGFFPSHRKDVIKVGGKSSGEILIWSENTKRLKSTFSKSYLKTQGMRIADTEPLNSACAYVSTEYVVSKTDQGYRPGIEALKHKAKGIIGESNYWFFSARILTFFHRPPNVKTFLLPTRAEKKEKEGIPNKE